MQSKRNQLLQSAIAGGIAGRRTTLDEVEVVAKQILRRCVHLPCAARCVDDDGGGTSSLQRGEFRGEVERGELFGQTDDFTEVRSDRGEASRIFARERIASRKTGKHQLRPSTEKKPRHPLPLLRSRRLLIEGAVRRSSSVERSCSRATPNPLLGTNRTVKVRSDCGSGAWAQLRVKRSAKAA